VFNGDTAYITQLKHNVNVLLSNSTFLIFAVLNMCSASAIAHKGAKILAI